MHPDGQAIGSAGIVCQGVLVVTMKQEESSLFGLNIDQQSSAALKSASQWGRFLAILGFILGVLISVLGLIIYIKITTGYHDTYRGLSAARRLGMRYLIVFFLSAAVMITGAVFTLNFSNKVATALHTHDQSLLNNGLSAIKNGIIFWSVLFVIFVLLMLLFFLGIVLI